MQHRILPGRGSGGRSRTMSSGTGRTLAVSRSKAGRSASKPSMICSMRCCGEWATSSAVADATSTTPASVNTPGRIPRPAPGPSNNTSRIWHLPFLCRVSGAAKIAYAARLIVYFQRHPVQSCLPLSAIPWGHTRSREASPVAIFLRFLLTSVRGHWIKSLLILACLLIEMGFNASISMSFKFLIDRAVIPQNMQVLWLILGVLIGGVVLVFCVGLGRDYLYAQVSTAVLNDLRQGLFTHLQRLSLDFYARTTVGEITARFATDLAAVEQALTSAASGVFLPALDVLSCLVLLFVLEWRLALVALLMFPFVFLGPEILDRRAASASYGRKQQEARVVTTVQQTFSAPAVVKAFGLERYMLRSFTQQLHALARTSIQVGFLSALMERSSLIGFLLTYVLMTAGGAYMAIKGVLSVGAFMSCQALFLTMGWTLAFGMQYAPRLVQATGGMQRIIDLFNEVPLVTDLPEATPLPPLAGAIAFEDVTFGYRPNQLNLNGVSFTIHAGESVAIVGPSGAGKSTVLALLARFYDPLSGRITVDGRDVRHAPQAAWRAQIGLVAQDSFLFDTTIGENIRLGKLDAPPTAVEAAAGLAGLQALLVTLPEGYDTMVGEGGGQLSGGQRQRVALARALLRDPALL